MISCSGGFSVDELYDEGGLFVPAWRSNGLWRAAARAANRGDLCPPDVPDIEPELVGKAAALEYASEVRVDTQVLAAMDTPLPIYVEAGDAAVSLEARASQWAVRLGMTAPRREDRRKHEVRWVQAGAGLGGEAQELTVSGGFHMRWRNGRCERSTKDRKSGDITEADAVRLARDALISLELWDDRFGSPIYRATTASGSGKGGWYIESEVTFRGTMAGHRSSEILSVRFCRPGKQIVGVQTRALNWSQAGSLAPMPPEHRRAHLPEARIYKGDQSRDLVTGDRLEITDEELRYAVYRRDGTHYLVPFLRYRGQLISDASCPGGAQASMPARLDMRAFVPGTAFPTATR